MSCESTSGVDLSNKNHLCTFKLNPLLWNSRVGMHFFLIYLLKMVMLVSL